jgi:hypothetical protein
LGEVNPSNGLEVYHSKWLSPVLNGEFYPRRAGNNRHIPATSRHQMSDSNREETNPIATEVSGQAAQELQKNRSRRGGAKRSGRPVSDAPDAGRQNRSRIERGMAGFADGVERAICVSVSTSPPRCSPVQHRTGLAVRRLVTVDRIDSALLLCDDSHVGPHVWPNGDVVGGWRLPDAPSQPDDDLSNE